MHTYDSDAALFQWHLSPQTGLPVNALLMHLVASWQDSERPQNTSVCPVSAHVCVKFTVFSLFSNYPNFLLAHGVHTCA